MTRSPSPAVAGPAEDASAASEGTPQKENISLITKTVEKAPRAMTAILK
ncbi:hypothetical protein NLM27_08860 [Bradyrhizobium sp. CCGB12]|nr:hypothetical protein [Bradyrhizobium sp. CCGB12]MCP3388884.1 hypothetical protein [Bradyrhizobium sp. CCGB12]